jgi:hypothetical protein
MIGTNNYLKDISFLKKNTNCKIIKNKSFYDTGFLKFAENWSIPKFVYGASFGFKKWTYTKLDEKIVKKLLSLK